MDLTERTHGNEHETLQDIKREALTQDKPQQKDKAKKPRYRASIACVACRDRRIRVCLLQLFLLRISDFLYSVW
jgi:hypothetical protein